MTSRHLQLALALTAGACSFATITHAYEIDRKTSSVIVRSVDDFVKCAQDSGSAQECLDSLMRYVDEKPQEALQAAKRVRLEYRDFAALPFFDKALQHNGAPEVCDDKDLRMAVTSGLGLPTDHPQAAIAQKIVQDRCWTELQEKILSEIKSEGSYYQANACPILRTKRITAAECEARPGATFRKSGLGPKVFSDGDSRVTFRRVGLTQEMRSLKTLEWQDLALDRQSAVEFRGRDSEEVLMVRAASPNDSLYVVKLRSIRGPWRDRVFVVRERPQREGRDYVTVVNNREWVLMTARNGYYEVYPQGYTDGVYIRRVAPEKDERAKSADEIVRELN